MTSDLRTSARDLLTLAQKVSTVLQRHSDRLLGEIEGARKSLSPKEVALCSEQSQRALDVRQQIWEASKLLKSALEHVEDIEDEDEPRILREHMDVLQVHIKDGLKLASDAESKAVLGNGHQEPESAKTAAAEIATPVPAAAARISHSNVGAMASGTSPLTGSMHRHPVGIFSTSPKFTAKSPFSTSARGSISVQRFPPVATVPVVATTPSSLSLNPAIASSPGVKAAESTSSTRSLDSLGPLEPSLIPSPLPATKSTFTPASSSKQVTRSTPMAFSEGPLSFATDSPVAKTSDKGVKVGNNHNSAKTALTSSTSSTSSTSRTLVNATSMALDPAFSPPAKAHAETPVSGPAATAKASSTPKYAGAESANPTKGDSPSSNMPSQRRRVPRGLFCSESTSVSETLRISSHESGSYSSVMDHSISRSLSEGSASKLDHGSHSREVSDPSRAMDAATQGLTSSLISSSSQSPTSQPPTPSSPLTSTYSSSSASGFKSPSTPPLQRSQPKPSPIQTTASVNSTPRSYGHGGRSKWDDDEGISQLARDLERAMNPTPTEPAPQPYFLQGEGLLQRMPNQISVEGGHLDEDDGGQQSEESDTAETQGEGSGLSRGTGPLRRQRSGSRRQFRISRSRSRNRSKGRHESRNKQVLMPIEVGYPSALTSSEWPFGGSPPRGRSTIPSASVLASSGQSQRDQGQPWQPRVSPRLPFAESVAIGNPIRVGKGIASFTAYNITLKLCEPAKAKLQAPPNPSRSREDGLHGARGEGAGGSQAGYASEDSRSIHNSGSIQSIGEHSGVRVMDEAAKDGRSTTANTQSKASLMMTRSLSFPELGRSAEQLLTGIQSVEESISPFLNGASTTAGSMESRTTLQAEQEPISAPLQERIVRVRKRYSDFVALRAQLVDMLKAQSRLASRANGGRGLFSLPSSGRNSVVISTSSTPVTSRSPRYSEDHGSNVGNDDDEDEDEDRESNWHSRTSSGAFGASTGSSPTLVLCSSILRGMPKLPPKKVMGKFRPAFVEKRRRELEYFLEWIVAHPVIGDCPVVVQWFLGQP